MGCNSIEQTQSKSRVKLLSTFLGRTMDECWLWPGSTPGFGYGVFTADGKTYRAHRVAYEMFVGDIPDGALVCHRCDNPACINPSHLFLGTHQDNADDRNSKGRQAQEDRHGRWKGGVSKNYQRRIGLIPSPSEKKRQWAERVIAKFEERRKASREAMRAEK